MKKIIVRYLTIGLSVVSICLCTSCGKIIVDSGSGGGGGGNEISATQEPEANTTTVTTSEPEETSSKNDIKITVKGTEVTVNEKTFKYDKDNESQFDKELIDYIESILKDDSSIIANFEDGDYNLVNKIQSHLDSLGVKYTLEKK